MSKFVLRGDEVITDGSTAVTVIGGSCLACTALVPGSNLPQRCALSSMPTTQPPGLPHLQTYSMSNLARKSWAPEEAVGNSNTSSNSTEEDQTADFALRTGLTIAQTTTNENQSYHQNITFTNEM